MDTFTRSYMETALWAETDGNAPLDKNYTPADFADETLTRIVADCERFQAENAEVLGPFDLARAGHDFWLTRNRHGAGFWDGDYPDAVGKALTDASHSFGECDLYVGDDGKIYC